MSDISATFSGLPTRGSTFDRFMDVRRNVNDAQTLVEPYIEYVASVSPDHMAVSLELSTFVWLLCCDLRPVCVADFGSGFSSFLLRAYAKQAPNRVTVLSVDDSPEWLDATAEFLKCHDLPTDGLISWDDWKSAPDRWPRFDLAVHDFASGDLREGAMALVADQMRPGGALIFDDAHHEGHKEAMDALCASRGWTLACLPETRDQFMRYGAMTVC